MGFDLTYDIRKQLQSFAKLAVGWHYSTGGPIPQSRIDSAIELCTWLEANGFNDIHAFPGEDCCILLAVYISARYDLDIFLEANDTITVVFDDLNECQIYKEGLDENTAKEVCLTLPIEI